MHKTTLFILYVYIFLPLMVNSQSVAIQLKVLQGFSPQAKLYIYRGSQVELVDSSRQIAPGEYSFTLQSGYDQGLYRIDIGKGTSINVVVSDEPIIDISTVVYAPEDSLKSIHSKENCIYWKYQREKKKHGQHTWLLRSLMDFYPDSVMFYNLLIRELENQNSKLYNLAKLLYTENSNLLSAKLIFTEQRPIIPRLFPSEEQALLYKDIWWQGIDFSDTRLLNSPALANRVWGYVELLFSDNYDKEEQDQAFIQGIEKLMALDMQIDIKENIRMLLIDGFVNSDYLEVVEYIETTSFNGLTLLREPAKLTSDKDHPRINLGEKAYDFFVIQNNGKKVKLSKIKAQYKLLVFWSSWCPHCIESLPRIADVYNIYKDKGLEVIAISIDEEETIWKDYVNKMNLSWINIREQYSPDSKLLKMYGVEETPKMFLLSKDLTIISRPATRRQLEVKLKRLLN
jgi:peroxiredoxin